MTPEEGWRSKSDEELMAASLHLDDFSDVGQRVIAAELQRRGAPGLSPALQSAGASDGNGGRDTAVDVAGGPVVRLWRGDISLPITYWLWGVTVNWGLTIAMALAERAGSVTLLLLLAPAGVAYYVLISVSIWRSANRYRGNRLWAHLAQVSVAAGTASQVVGIAALVVEP